MAAAIKTVYCAQCRVETGHEMALDKNQEIVATCSTCQRQIKFPLASTPEALNAMLTAHKRSSAGQVTVEMAAEKQKVHDAKFLKTLGITG